MLFRINAVLVAAALALPILVVATPLAPRTENACNSGNLHCCESTMSTSNPAVASLTGLLGLAGNLGGTLGFQCSSLNFMGLLGNKCSQQTVCCTGNQFNGLITTGCSPVNLGL